jgi:hypothetical protein
VNLHYARLSCYASALFLLAASACAQSGTANIVKSAESFLATLDDKQRGAVLFAYDDEQQRARWSNLPTALFPRRGLSLRELNAAQRTAAFSMLSSALSASGMEKVRQIIESDEVLKTSQRNNPMFGGDLYYFSILGTPSEQHPWMLQFGGHHLAINVTIAGDSGILTPTFTGAQPAMYSLNGKAIRPLGRESDKAVALLMSLDAEQRKQAILGYKLVDLVLGPGLDGKTIQPEGLKASAMSAKQRELLVDLIAEWAGIVHDSSATARMADLKADLDETWFAWSGPVEVKVGTNIPSYYRIQGPRLVIEYAPQQLGGDLALHVHSMYRDPTNDYGRKPSVK